MLEAHLRGLLRPVASITDRLVEGLTLESLHCEQVAEAQELRLRAQWHFLRDNDQEQRQAVAKELPGALNRIRELRSRDMYAKTREVSHRANHQSSLGKLSLVQVFKLLRDRGMIRSDDDPE